MSFLSTSELKSELSSIIVEGFNQNNIDASNYELALGSTYFVSDSEEFRVFTGKNEDFITINPGQFALLITQEIVKIPLNRLGFISIKASIKFRGLVNISGFHVDPGFNGRLKFSVHNAGSNKIILKIGAPTFQLWLSELKSDADPYNGTHKNQKEITPEDLMNFMQGSVASPAELKKEIDELRHSTSEKIWLFRFLIGIGFAIGLKLMWDWGSLSASQKYENVIEQKINENMYSGKLDRIIDSCILTKNMDIKIIEGIRNFNYDSLFRMHIDSTALKDE